MAIKQLPIIQYVAVSFADGSVAILQFVVLGYGTETPINATRIDNMAWFREPTQQNVALEVNKTFSNVGRVGTPMPTVVGFRLINQAEFTALDRDYREAWTEVAGQLQHDMAKAKNAHRNRLRLLRRAKFEDLDAQWMRAVATRNNQLADTIEAQRQVLRDLPADPRIDAAVTVADLKAVVVP